MRTRLLAAIGVLALAVAALLANVAGIAQTLSIPYVTSLGQNDIQQVIPNAAPQAGNQYATLTQLRSWIMGGGSAHSAAPVLSSCGTSPAIAGSDFAGRITTGTGTPTGCVATFASAFTSIPACVVVSQTAYATSTPSYVVSATAITITQAAVNSVIYDYVCVAQNGG